MEEVQPVLKYIKEAKDFGFSDREILISLISAGWQFQDIFEAVLDYSGDADLPNQSEKIIFVENLNKSFGNVQALKDVSLSVQKGSITALLGPNGAGKTTLIRILTTLLKPDSGEARVGGFDVIKNPQSVRRVVGLAGQSVALDEILTGRENLEMFAQLYHLSRGEAVRRAEELLVQFDLLDAAERQVRTYSGGMRRRLDLAASLIANPPILFLDEPTTGLDPRSRFTLWQIIQDLAKNGATILLTTQYMEEADQLADKIIVIDHGQIIARGTADDLKKQVGGDVVEVHLTNYQDGLVAIKAVQGLAKKWPNLDDEMGRVSFSAKDGSTVLTEAVRQLDNAGIGITDIIFRRPTLDDVFLALTGHVAE